MQKSSHLSDLVSRWKEELKSHLESGRSTTEAQSALALLQQMEKTFTQTPEGQSTDLIKPPEADAQPSLGDVDTMGSEENLRDVKTVSHSYRGGDDNPGNHKANKSGPVPETSTVRGYQIVRELGRGGMGVVYQAIQPELKRTVALKMILAGGHASESQLQRFRIEAEAVARLKHPNIVQIYEIGEQNGLPYFSLEFCEGGALNDKLDGTPWQENDAAKLMQILATGMQAAHEAGVVHRDLKPHNVLLDANGTPKITDFGLAKRLEEGEGVTNTESVMGTPSYMAPEQAKGKTKEVGPAADVYSLGAMLYELLTGRPPFKAASAWDTIAQVINEEPVSPRQLNPKVSKDLETVCLKCLHKEPGKRYESAESLAEELRRFQDGEPIQARPVSRIEKTWRWCKRHPGVACLWLLVLVTLLGGSGISTFFAIRADQKASDEEKARREAQQLAQSEKMLKEQALESAKREKALTASEKKLKEAAIQSADREKSLANKEKKARELAQEREKAARYQARRAQTARHAIQVDMAFRTWKQHDLREVERILGDVPRSFVDTWEVQHLRSLCRRKAYTFKGHTSDVISVAFSPDGKRIVSASKDGAVQMWEIGTGKVFHSLKGDPGDVTSVTFRPDGKHMVIGGASGVKVWDVQNGEEVLVLKSFQGKVNSVAYSPDGKRLLTAGGGRSQSGKRIQYFAELKIWDAETGKELVALQGHNEPVNCVAFSPNGRRIVSGTGNPGMRTPKYIHSTGGYVWEPRGELKVWDAVTGKKILSLSGHGDTIRSVAFSPDGKRIVSGAQDQRIRVWDAHTAQSILTLQGHTDYVMGVAFSSDGKHVVSASRDGALKVWDAITGAESLTLRGHTSGINSMAFSSDGKYIVSGSGDRTVRVWDLSVKQGAHSLQGHKREIYSVAFSPNGKRMVSGSRDKTVKIWDTATGKELLSLQGHRSNSWIHSVAYSPDGSRVASGSNDKTVKVWDASTGKELLTLKGHTGSVSSVSFSPDGMRIVSGSLGYNRRTERGWGEVRVWDAQTGQQLLNLQGHSSTVNEVAFSPGGERIASASADGSVRIWNAENGEVMHTLRAKEGSVLSVAFGPQGKRIATGTGIVNQARSWISGRVTVWDLTTGKVEVSTKNQLSAICRVRFSPDGQRIVSGSFKSKVQGKPGGVKLWDVTTGQEVLKLEGHTDSVYGVAFHPSGTRIVTVGGGYDSTKRKSISELKIWDAVGE